MTAVDEMLYVALAIYGVDRREVVIVDVARVVDFFDG